MEPAFSNIKNSFLLHWVFKIKNLKETLNLLNNQLGLKVLRHEEFNTACEASCNGKFDNAWSKTMVGLGDEMSHFAFELVFNYGHVEEYRKHKGFSCVEFYTKNSENFEGKNYQNFQMENYQISKFNKNYAEDYLKVLNPQISEEDFNKDFKFLTLEVNNLEESVNYYNKILLMEIMSRERIINLSDLKNLEEFSEDFKANNQRNFSVLGFGKNQTLLKLVQLPENEKVIQDEDSGRMAYACETDVFEIKKVIENSGDKILHQPVVLKTEGKADVKVIILQDKNDYEICFVEKKGFRDLSTLTPGVEKIDWEMRDAIVKKILRDYEKEKNKGQA